MKPFKSISVLLFITFSSFSFANGLTYEEGERVFKADMWNEVFGRSYPYKIDENVIVTGSELKGNVLTHHMTFYERKFPFNLTHWEEGAKAMAIDNFCKKEYIKYFPVTFKLEVVIRENERSNPKGLETIIVNTKDVCTSSYFKEKNT